ncbi:hypothetical protein CY34DRAFT_161844 [Suillus luteus UH-Slu-Lm8-n1]|uniref:Arginine--tRNA ligase n=1 Tax=Suillus luteus UH-Slu-Lm8-n1 TaxID=930992 RepID=A0A0C9Z4E5_9AGAM|nr:hypothetical protein CY34DRAFT_161844 [Suillus luteus UH-Slu-Lm8-n1]
MAAKQINNYTFNWDRMLFFDGDTGPYLQYLHVRLTSMERKKRKIQSSSPYRLHPRLTLPLSRSPNIRFF